MNATQRAPSTALIRVLLVDDDRCDHRLISDLLDSILSLRFAIDRVSSLAEGVDRLGQTRFDVCLLDLHLPDGDGLDFLASADTLGLMLPVIVLTEFPSPEQDQRALTLGAAAFLEKSKLDPVTLERTIRYAIHQRRVTEGLARQAFLDEPTGLISRPLYRERLDRALAFARRRDREVAVVMIDLAFDPDLDMDEGRIDATLAEIRRRLVGDLRETDSVARLSCQRVALLIEGIRSLDHVATVARKALRLLRAPFDIDGRKTSLLPSVGVAIYPREAGDGHALLRHAEAAMRRAIADGGGCCRFGSERVDCEAREGMVLERSFAVAFEGRELRLGFSPEVYMDGRGAGLAAEVLWRHPEEGWVSSLRALGDTDDSRLIKGIADWSLASAAEQLLAWEHERLTPHRLSLAIPFRRRPALAFLQHAAEAQIGARGVTLDRIELELREDLVLDDARRGCSDLIALKTMGLRLALDDFGEGRAAIQDLRHDLLDSVKLASGLCADLPKGDQNTMLVRALIALGHNLELEVIAKGADDKRRFALLKRFGCDAVRLSAAIPPMSAEAATAWLRTMVGEPEKRGNRRPAPTPEILVPGTRHRSRTQTKAPSPPGQGR